MALATPSFALGQNTPVPWPWAISSDFGPRDLDSGPTLDFDFHEGVDYNAATGDADLGTPIPAVESGNISAIANRGAFFQLEVDGIITRDVWLYGHIFRNNAFVVGDWELAFDAEHVNPFDLTVRTRANVIVRRSGGAIVKILSTQADRYISDGQGGFLRGADGQPVLTRRFVDALEQVAPMGDANITDVTVHLHLGLNYPHDNPMFHLQHPPDALPTATILSPTANQAFGPRGLGEPRAHRGERE